MNGPEGATAPVCLRLGLDGPSQVLERAWAAGLQRIIITAGSLAEARKALALAQTDGDARAHACMHAHRTALHPLSRPCGAMHSRRVRMEPRASVRTAGSGCKSTALLMGTWVMGSLP